MTKHHKSAHGKDFKVLAQIALFVLWEHFENQEKQMWLSLCKVHTRSWSGWERAANCYSLSKKIWVFQSTYCKSFHPDDVEAVDSVIKEFI